MASIRQTVTAVRHQVVFALRTKTGKPRVIRVPAETCATLRAWRRRQAEERLAMGAGYASHDLVFTLPDGRPYHPDRFSTDGG